MGKHAYCASSPLLAPQEHGDERSALPLFSIDAATQRADFFGQPWDLVIPEAQELHADQTNIPGPSKQTTLVTLFPYHRHLVPARVDLFSRAVLATVLTPGCGRDIPGKANATMEIDSLNLCR